MDNKKRSRREVREDIIKTLYQMDIHQEFVYEKTSYPFYNESLQGIIDTLTTIDETIQQNLQKWKINRLSFVDRAIIRFATYEMIETNTPHEIIINEALNITRKYSDEGDSKMVGFTNRVLDNISKSLKKVG
ncbi:transcription antitermination factor NusB [Candidatus Xianfuyuplasma coldseepsis]|uniref:Transcription antitermination protein NusB n=1 Tax=Candidatus Xianfuyuplasma coldseepsis TaxID=2782163 RepID=A0A7L7KUL5_9MOLU|nr:transcription antitermination factor NusB [Xianfuyuplasma coldseepsis]QMS85684.1 transcription antitermination factor NusB [Xianfuyuplasma coldseepsis]